VRSSKLPLPVLQVFDPLPARERWFVRGRAFTAPLLELERRAPAGKIADVGCGHGVLTALLARDRPDRQVFGVDPDAWKIAQARQGPGQLGNVVLEACGIEGLLPAHRGSFDAVIVCDVLYLLPISRWAGFLETALRLLKPTGVLLLKEAEGNGSWKHWKCLLQEMVMVGVLRRTRSSGAIVLQPRSATESLLQHTGFRVEEVVDLSKGYTTPHVLFVARPVTTARS
jgi:2-polyprenyl-3-methyl-5-hydroxy-6-metoxy-1,4-benzoquinol methylase